MFMYKQDLELFEATGTVFLRLYWWCECVLSQVRQHFLHGQAWAYVPYQAPVLLVAVFHNTSSLTKSAHTYTDTLWPTTHHSVLLKASFMWNFPISLQAFLPSVNKQLKFLSKHTSIFHNFHSIQSKVILIIQFT